MKFILTTILISFTNLFIFSQDQKEDVTYKITSTVFNSEREFSVYLPEGYDQNPDLRFGVAYVFDGQFQPYVDLVISTLNYYAQANDGQPMIVVGIKSTNRSLEFTPKENNPKTKINWRGNCGNADLLSKSLETEIFPIVDSIYRTSTYRLGIGHSLGGTYLFNEIFKEKSLFNGIIAASPNLTYDDEQLLTSGKEFLGRASTKTPFIYTSAGDEGEMEQMFAASLRKMDSIVVASKSTGVIWKSDFYSNVGHMTSFLPTLNNGLVEFAKYWYISDDEKKSLIKDSTKNIEKVIIDYYSKLSLFTGQKEVIDNTKLNNLAYQFSNLRGYKRAIEILDLAILKFPQDPNLYDTRGEMYEKSRDFVTAKKNYKKALIVLDENKVNFSTENYDYYKKAFQTNYDRLSDDFIKYVDLSKLAKMEMEKKNYKKASEIYEKAFKLNVIKGTNLDRKMACGAFAQVNKIEEAFVQLEMLTNLFQWRGGKSFSEDELLTPLKSDPRWNQYVSIIEGK